MVPRSSSVVAPSAASIIGRSPGLRRVLAQVERIAPTVCSVLVTGETGTGKEGIARLLHEQSGRRGPLVVVNCASLPADLVESELFGHERGAFTGAVGRKRGLVVEAEGGTLFLDEVGELPAAVQAKLLRLLQEKEIRPVGAERTVKVDVRVVAATWRDLRACAAEGAFRDDLRFRLATFEVALPPLRERGDDVVLLAEHVVAGLARTVGIGPRTLGRSAGAALRGYDWPGNVRELQTVLMRAAVLVKPGDAITGAQIRAVLPAPASTEASIEDRVEALLTSAGEVGIGQVMAALRVPRTTAWRAMAVLVERGVVEATGLTKGRRYALVAVANVAAVPSARDPRWGMILALVRRGGRVNRQRVVEAMALPERTAGRLLAAMACAGVLVPDGRGRAMGYVAA